MQWPDWLQRMKRQRLLRQEVRALRAEVAVLREQNERMRAGMRRCLSCEYRIQVLEESPGAVPQ